MERPNFFLSDCESIWSKLKHEEKHIQSKRRWLLGLPASETKWNQYKRAKISETGYVANNSLLILRNPPDFHGSLPESFLREEDIFYDTVKSYVEKAFGMGCAERGHQVVEVDLQLLEMHKILRFILSRIDDLTTRGLYFLATTLMEGQEFEKTRLKMKKVVKDTLLVIFGSKDHNRLMEISRQLFQFLNDPQNFRDNRVPCLTSSFLMQRAAATNILDKLGDFSTHTLIAMHKKLKEVEPTIPQLHSGKNGWNRDYLISRVRTNSEKMLLKLGKGDQPPEPLSKAMAVAGLSLKLTPGFHNSSTTEFLQFSPDTKILQNEIAKAIWLVKTKCGGPELNNVKNLLDPNAKVPQRALRTAISKMLTEYLFQCSDMDVIPNSLLKTLATINKHSRRTPDEYTLEAAIHEEVECILNVSAHTKQMLLDLLPAHDFDVDFADAYMEDLEESDDNDDDCVDDKRDLHDDSISQNSSSNSVGFDHEVESTGDSVPFNLKQSTPTTRAEDPCPILPDERLNHSLQTTYKNPYLAIQEVCDETSMVAYNLIGRILEKFGHKEGLNVDWDCSLYLRGNCANKEDSQEEARASTKESDSMIVVRVIEELIPSFAKSGIERLRELMGQR